MSLKGSIVILREEQPEDLKFFVDLRNDLDTQAWPKALPPDYTECMYHKRFEGREFSFDRRDGRFTIIHQESGERVGAIVCNDIEPRFAASIGIIVHKKFWGSGAALDAQETLLKFLFVHMGLRVVRLWTHSGNPSAVKLAEKSGFQLSGRLRQSVFRGGELLDGLMMDVLRKEYFVLHSELTDNLPPL